LSKFIRLLVTILLMLPVVSLPAVQSQAYTTVTTPVATSYGTTTYTTDYGSSPYAGKLGGTPGIYVYSQGSLLQLCPIVYDYFVVTQGAEVSFSITSNNNPLVFYIMTAAQFASLNIINEPDYSPITPNVVVCGTQNGYNGAWPAVFAMFQILTSYETAWTAPGDGQYYWILTTGNSRKSVQYTLNVWSAKSQVETFTMYTTATNPIPASTTMNLLKTEAISQPLTQAFTFSADQLYAGGAVVFAALFVVTLVMLLRQRKRKR